LIYRFISFLFRLALRVFFRRMEVGGLDKIPESGPVIFLPNHINALVDALVILRYVKRPVYLTAKSTLAEYRVIDYMMKSAQVIRFYRKQDQQLGADRSKNVLALAECLQRLEEGSGLCIFPEGQSHSDPSLRPFRWGAARLAAETGAPVLEDALAWLDCTIHARHPAGTHTIYVGEVQASATPHPDESFMAQVARNLTDAPDGFLLPHRFLICDRDTKFTAQFRRILKDFGVDTVLTPHRAPNCNAFGERSLHRAIREYVQHYHLERPHQGLGNLVVERSADSRPTPASEVRTHERLGGLLRHYKAAA